MEMIAKNDEQEIAAYLVEDSDVADLNVDPDEAGPIALLIVDGGSEWSEDFMRNFIEGALNQGVRYFVGLCPDSSGWEDITDLIVSEQQEENVGTSWHESDTPEEVVDFFINHTDDDGEAFHTFYVVSLDADGETMDRVTTSVQKQISK